MAVLVAACPHIASAYAVVGMPPARDREDGFATLLRIIIDQQVSVQSGAAIWQRLATGLGDCSPQAVLEAGEDRLRSFGLSRPKADYAACLAQAINEGRLDLAALRQADNEAVHAQLTAIKGIGRWTADIYLMFALGRPDIWPAGDLALAEAARRILSLNGRPTPDQLDVIGERWRPERTTAAVFLWHCYKKLPPA
ncbi:MAG: DNA-3-methyladenine glycosylase 2 family protein [Rhodospirillales bacterium]|nr:DNA-3-methyladenine glycosylase 2 family protein [Rhodospirillales bacterium]